MEAQNVPGVIDGGRKRKASGYVVMKRRHVIVEEQLEVVMEDKRGFGDFVRTGEGPCKRTD
jgi:hypothetical protein